LYGAEDGGGGEEGRHGDRPVVDHVEYMRDVGDDMMGFV
jgi:hypothetical protein